ncbi:hypothetical protein [Enterococcus sp. AZ109]|uniref:hypothetical protein n=1 Tax=Enterococcus sp. AZ109 TaxID=2774634 RepID=UPI003F20F1AB
MRNLKIIRGFGMAFLIGAILSCRIFANTSLEVTLAIVVTIAAVIIVPTEMISADKEYEERKKRLNRR